MFKVRLSEVFLTSQQLFEHTVISDLTIYSTSIKEYNILTVNMSICKNTVTAAFVEKGNAVTRFPSKNAKFQDLLHKRELYKLYETLLTTLS